MAKKVAKKKEEVKKGLEIKVKLELTGFNRLTARVELLQDGEVISKDYDWVNLE